MTGLLCTLLLFPFIGSALGRLLPGVPRFLAGAGATGTLLFLMMFAGLRLPFALAILVLAALLVWWRTSGTPAAPIRYPLVPTVWLLLVAAWLLAVTSIVPLADYDGRAFWLLKAKAISHEQTVAGPFFRQQTSPSPRNQYPLLLPIDAAVVMTLAGELDDRQVRGLYACFAIAFALVVRRRLAELFTPAIGAWLAAVTLTIPVMLAPGIGAASAGADIALGAFAACAFFELVTASEPLQFGIWLSFIVLTKSEGLPLALLLLAVGIPVFRKRILLAGIPFITCGAVLLAWRTVIHRSDESAFAQLIATVPEHAGRFRMFLHAWEAQAVSFQWWGGLWLAVVVALVLLAWHTQWRPALLTLGVMLPMLLLYTAVVAVTDWDPEVMTGLAPRLLTHLLGPALYAIGAATYIFEQRSEERDRLGERVAAAASPAE